MIPRLSIFSNMLSDSLYKYIYFKTVWLCVHVYIYAFHCKDAFLCTFQFKKMRFYALFNLKRCVFLRTFQYKNMRYFRTFQYKKKLFFYALFNVKRCVFDALFNVKRCVFYALLNVNRHLKAYTISLGHVCLRIFDRKKTSCFFVHRICKLRICRY